MQRAPGETVTLSLRDQNGRTSTCSNVPNTLENRKAVWRARGIRAGVLEETYPPFEGVTVGDICD